MQEKAKLEKIINDAKESGTLKTGADLKDQDAMDTTQKSDHSHTSFKNQHGNYPKWLSKNKVDKLKKISHKRKATKKNNQKKSKV